MKLLGQDSRRASVSFLPYAAPMPKQKSRSSYAGNIDVVERKQIIHKRRACKGLSDLLLPVGYASFNADL